MNGSYYNAASPIGASSIGYLPSNVDRYYADMNRGMALQQSFAANVESPRVRFLTEQVARTLYGPNYQAAMAGNDGRMLQSVMAVASARGWLGGGRPQSLVAATQNFASSGASFSNAGFGGSAGMALGSVAGMGPVTMATAGLLQQSAAGYFFDPRTGAQRMGRTSGMGYDGLAGIMSIANARGMMGPLEVERYGMEQRDSQGRITRLAGDVARDQARSLRSREKAFRSSGDDISAEATGRLAGQLESKIAAGARGENVDYTTLALSTGSEQRINRVLKEGTAAMASVVDVFGKQDFKDLLFNLEKISGLRAGGDTSFSEMRQRFERVRSKIEATGLDVNAAMGSIVEASAAAEASARSRGERGMVAGRVAAAAGIRRISTIGAARADGRNVDDARLQAELEMGINSTMRESMVGAGEMSALLELGLLTPEQAKAARSAMSDFSNARTVDARLAANDRLSALSDKFGFRSGNLVAQLGAEKVAELGGDTFLNAASASNTNLERYVTARQNVAALLGGNQLDVYSDLMGKFSGKTMSAAEEALVTGNKGQLEKLLGKEGAASLSSAFGSPEGWLRLRAANRLRGSGLVGAGGLISDEYQEQLASTEEANRMAKTFLGGEQRYVEPGFIESMLAANGVIPQDVTDSQLAAFLGAKGKTDAGAGVFSLGTIGPGGFSMDDASARALAGKLGISVEDIKGANSGTKLQRLREALERGGFTLGATDGKITAASRWAIEAARSDHSELFELSRELQGDSNFQRLSPEAQQKILEKARGVMSGDRVRLNTSEFKQAVQDAKVDARAAAGNPNNLGGSGNNGYLGVMQIVGGNNVTLAVHSANGANGRR